MQNSDMYAWEEARETALETFEKNRGSMMKVAVKRLEKVLKLSEQTPFKPYHGDKPYEPAQHTSPSLSKCFEMDVDGQSCTRNKATCQEM